MNDAAVAASRAPAGMSGHAAPLLEIDDVTVQNKTDQYLITTARQVSFKVYPFDRYMLLGPSGCGKSALLKAVGGYVRPKQGVIRLKGREILEPGPDRMMVFQEFDQLLPWKTVRQNVEFALETSGRLKGAQAAERAAYYLDKAGMRAFQDSYPHMLSGGMKQRASIARGMAMEADVLLLDDPFAALDAMTRLKMQDELLRLWDDTHFTMMFATRRIDEAVKIGTRILLLSPHPGRVKAELNSIPADEMGSENRSRLEARINEILFASDEAGA